MSVPWDIRDYPLTSPPEAFGRFEDFVRLWQSKRDVAQKNGRILPAWKDFDLIELRPWWGCLALLKREYSTGEFYVQLWGTKVSDWFGKDVTNKSLDDLFASDPERKKKGMDHLDLFFKGEVIAFWKEVPTHFLIDYAFIEGLSVPLSRDGTTTTHMMSIKNRVTAEDDFWPPIPHVAEF